MGDCEDDQRVIERMDYNGVGLGLGKTYVWRGREGVKRCLNITVCIYWVCVCVCMGGCVLRGRVEGACVTVCIYCVYVCVWV